MLQDRILAARGVLHRTATEALLFVHMPNVRYLSGFSGSDGAVLVEKAEGSFLTDSRYTTQAGSEVDGLTVVEYPAKLKGVAASIEQSGAVRVGFEADHVTVAFLNELSSALPHVEFVPLGAELDDLRIRKDAGEVALLEKTAALASAALMETLAVIRPGVVEREVALALEFAMKKAGADDKAFDFIVASGVRGALPHGRASDKVIAAGELVTIDYGARLEGYHSDETVTVAVGEADSRQREIYGIVKDAHDRAIEAVRPGIPLKELDGIARGYIEEQGYGRYFGHGLGHGVGLEIHEKPTVSFRSDAVLDEGMIITVEPGIYIPEWGGVRIEDTVVVTADGYRLLTRVSKDLMSV